MTIPSAIIKRKTIIFKDYIKEIYYKPVFKHCDNKKKNNLFVDENGVIIDKETYYLSQSLKRTKRTIRDLVLSNSWSCFITLTFDLKKCDSTDLEQCKNFIRYFERKLKAMKCDYLLIPEYHNDKKKVHFHGLLSGNIELIDSGCYKIPSIKKPLKLETCLKRGYDLNQLNAKKVYNLPSWQYGYASVIKVGQTALDNVKLGNYITKYITKDLITIFNKHRYFVSCGVRRPLVIETTSKYFREDEKYQFSKCYGNVLNYYNTLYTFNVIYEKPNDIDFAFDKESGFATFLNTLLS